MSKNIPKPADPETETAKPIGESANAPSLARGPRLDPVGDDPNAGLGGSYVVDPKTGRRTLVERTATTESPAPAPSGPAADPN